jgi:hypothetical protein
VDNYLILRDLMSDVFSLFAAAAISESELLFVRQ